MSNKYVGKAEPIGMSQTKRERERKKKLHVRLSLTLSAARGSSCVGIRFLRRTVASRSSLTLDDSARRLYVRASEGGRTCTAEGALDDWKMWGGRASLV